MLKRRADAFASSEFMTTVSPSSPQRGANYKRRDDSSLAGRPQRWTAKTRVQAQDHVLAQQCDLSPVTAAVLRARGYATAGAVQAFLNPTSALLRDPLLLPDMAPAVARLHRAIAEQEPILVFGDYDVDGVTSTALLARALRALKAVVRHHVPERADGYGLNVAAVEAAAQRGETLIVTADCGIMAHEAAQRARELGVDLVITDHHPPGAALPDAIAVVNPARVDSQYGFAGLSGCGVAFKLLQALMQTHWPRHAASFSDKFIELVALAAVADCVSLTDENRYLAAEGLRQLANTGKPGLQALMRAANLKVRGDAVSGQHVGFVLAPRLNAAGRIASPQLSLNLLLATDPAECERLAAEIELINRERQELTRAYMHEAVALVERESDLSRDTILVVAGEGWKHGVVGLVASRLCERYARPAITLGIENGTARGSGRSIAGFDLHGVLDHARDLLESGGGHAMACGLALPTERIADFRLRALEHAATKLQVADLVPAVEADCEVSGPDLTRQLVDDLEKLEPCGQDNPAARLMLRGARIQEGKPIGQAGQHLKWRIEADGRFFDAVWWSPGARADGFGHGHSVDLCFSPELNTYRGNVTLQLKIIAARPSR
jgi:single-stranded-DNA-specific exonuclease